MPSRAIRTATEADLAAILRLWEAAGNRPSVTDSESGLRQLLDRDPAALLLAECDGEAIGSLIATWDGWRGSFYRLAVHPSRRRQGVATALVKAGEERLRGLGAVRLTAIVIDEEADAVGLWEAVGFRRQDDTRRFVRMVESD